MKRFLGFLLNGVKAAKALPENVNKGGQLFVYFYDIFGDNFLFTSGID